MMIRSGASLHSSVELNLNNLSLEFGASLSMEEAVGIIKVSGEFHVGKSDVSAFSMRSTTLPSASIDADLDLTSTTLIVLEGQVDMNGHSLLLNQNTSITLNFDTAIGDITPLFTNVGILEIEGLGQIESNTDLTEALNFTFTGTLHPNDSCQIFYTDTGTLALQIIPEPATTTLSLLGICGLAMRRRRK